MGLTAVLLAAAAICFLTGDVLSLPLNENDACGPEPGWKCKKLGQCPWGLAEIKMGREPKICNSLFGKEPLVCCPEESDISFRAGSKAKPLPPVGEKSKAMCKKWSETVVVWEEPPISMPWSTDKMKVDLCGQVEEPLIAGGESAKGREFPHMGLLGYDNWPYWLCGCSLISEKYVLTAAHCMKVPPGIEPYVVRLGELDLGTTLDDARPEDYYIKRLITHPGYKDELVSHDIALVELERTVTFNAYIRPACLHTTWAINYNTSTATGWGAHGVVKILSMDLKKVKLKVQPNDVCRSTYRTSKQAPDGIVNATMICTLEDNKGGCSGDSGGPLVVSLKNPYCMYGIIGVASWNKGCNVTFLSVYTRVSYYVPWIESIVWP